MKKQSLTTFASYKLQQKKFATITAYDATFARISEQAGIECLLVGDSLGNVIQGQKSTVPVTIADMCYHTSCVAGAVELSFIMSDLPYMTYATPDQGILSAAELMQAGAQMVKLEGGEWLCETIQFMSERGMPTCSHLGLLPQSADKLGGYKVQGKIKTEAERLLSDAKALEDAGTDILLLECVPADLARQITEAVSIPVIGIGAGPSTDSQVLVCYDLLGLSKRLPKFSKNFLANTADVLSAIEKYGLAVRAGEFPGEEHIIA